MIDVDEIECRTVVLEDVLEPITMERYIYHHFARLIRIETQAWLQALEFCGVRTGMYAYEHKYEFNDAFLLFGEYFAPKMPYAQIEERGKFSQYEQVIFSRFQLAQMFGRDSKPTGRAQEMVDELVEDKAQRKHLSALIEKMRRFSDLSTLIAHSIYDIELDEEETMVKAFELSGATDGEKIMNISFGLDEFLQAVSPFDSYMKAYRAGVPVEDITA